MLRKNLLPVFSTALFSTVIFLGIHPVQAQTFTLTGHVSANGIGIAGATVSLVGQPLQVALTNTYGDFVLNSDPNVTNLKINSASRSAPRLSIHGNTISFSLPSNTTQGSVEFFSENGRQTASFPLNQLESGTSRVSLPMLNTGVSFMRVKLDQNSYAYKLVNTGNGVADVTPVTEIGQTNLSALSKTAATVDTLRILKAGYRIKKIAITSYAQSNLQVVADSSPACTVPTTFAAGSTLAAIAELPDPFKYMSGTRVSSPDDWRCRQMELKAMIANYEYGPYPAKPDSVQGTLVDTSLTVRVVLAGKSMTYKASVHLPAGNGPFPAFIMLTSTPLTAAILNARGIAYILFNTADIAADTKPSPATYPLNRSGGIYTLYGATSGISDLMAWGWAAGRILDVIPTAIPQIDPTKVAIMGFSRWGKGALVAGAWDERFALVVPSSSGSGGVGTYRNAYGVTPAVQTLTEIIGEAPQWFGDKFTTTDFGNAKESHLPYDAHATVALIAPRPVIITEGGADSWNNPPGPNLSAQAAQTVYKYLGISDYIGFRTAAGSGHALATQHQQAILVFADRFLLGKAVRTDTIFDLPYTAAQTKAATLMPWTAPAQ